jgi:hypothetical protein
VRTVANGRVDLILEHSTVFWMDAILGKPDIYVLRFEKFGNHAHCDGVFAFVAQEYAQPGHV